MTDTAHLLVGIKMKPQFLESLEATGATISKKKQNSTLDFIETKMRIVATSRVTTLDQ